ncbi:zinc ribbon domain-containing protein [Granulicella sp. dw_53]|uniref:zinc ribbon domain-containing protein n=1 Tax=Granulicella sp. dw_53 TaxID=2719792 RepID=UPI001BD4E1B4|nr:zinc ribbon domain-containing protein [Granulicella sp. dw_53]
MVCPACGTAIAGEGRFCPKCGAQVAGPQMAGAQMPGQQQAAGYGPPMYPMQALVTPRVQRNLQALGILWCVYGAYRAIGGLAGMFFLQMASMRGFGGFINGGWPYGGHWEHGPVWLAALVPFVAIYTVIVTGLALLVGYGLLTRRPWGRTLAIVAAVLALFKPVLGTALGIYTLWVLAPAQSGAEFDAIADRS